MHDEETVKRKKSKSPPDSILPLTVLPILARVALEQLLPWSSLGGAGVERNSVFKE
ncbi:hypothetical protein MHK_005194 [Candidatus Magnetomorum sp. HK-1]|nr:hypothetical protein MHK_005194 [Candidatus Magnetomorum sp. HK-1]